MVAVILAALSTWSQGVFNQFLPSPPRVVLAIENVIEGAPLPSTEHFRFVLTWVEDDPDGTYTNRVTRDFRQTEGVELVRSARIVTFSKASGAAGEWRPAMQDQAREILSEWNADVVIVGSATPDAGALSLWFVPILGNGTLDRQSYYVLNDYDAMLPELLREELRAQLVATALSAAAAAATQIRSQVLTDGLETVVNRINNLVGLAGLNVRGLGALPFSSRTNSRARR